jgi:hypothetical protein
MARFDRLMVLNTVLQDGLVPLFYHKNVETAQQVAAALAQAGGHVLEFTNRGDFAIKVRPAHRAGPPGLDHRDRFGGRCADSRDVHCAWGELYCRPEF